MFLDSIDEDQVTFSYSRFKDLIRNRAAVFNTVLTVSESSSSAAKSVLSTLSIIVPDNVGSESLTTFEGVTNVMKFTQEIYLALLYSQDKENLEEINKITEAIRSGGGAINTALARIRGEAEAGTSPISPEAADYLGVQVGDAETNRDSFSTTTEDTRDNEETQVSDRFASFITGV